LVSSEPSESCTCAICHDVLKNACALNCGHTFCAECITSCCAGSNNPSCPNCRVEIISANPNYAMRDVIGELAVKCPDSEECEWTGEVKDIESHGNTCMFKTIVCNVEGCNHTCQRKDMGDHTSNTVVMIRHLELKHDKKLKDMEEKYKTTITQLKGEIQSHKNKLQTHERRIRALESGKRSAEDMSNNNSDTPDEMVVEGCGVRAINGTYRRQGSNADAPMYVHSAQYIGLDVVFTIFRYGSTGCAVGVYQSLQGMNLQTMDLMSTFTMWTVKLFSHQGLAGCVVNVGLSHLPQSRNYFRTGR
jgi:hypothetical protein